MAEPESRPINAWPIDWHKDDGYWRLRQVYIHHYGLLRTNDIISGLDQKTNADRRRWRQIMGLVV